jgi:hypothetical protein
VKRIVGVLALVAVLVGLVAGPVAAQATTVHEQYEGTLDFYTYNPCNSEMVYVTGQFSGVFQSVETPSGEFNWTSNGQLTGTGEGDLGNTYVFSQTTSYNVKSHVNREPLIWDITAPMLLINKGSGGNFVTTTYWRVTGNGKFEFIGESGPECRG